jgi:hypothetical protein
MSFELIDQLIKQKRYTVALENILTQDWTESVELLKRKSFVDKMTSGIEEYLKTLAMMATKSENWLDKEFYICELVTHKQFENAFLEKSSLMKNEAYLQIASRYLAEKHPLFVNSFMFYRSYSFDSLKKSCMDFIGESKSILPKVTARMQLFIETLLNRNSYKEQFHPKQIATYIYYPGLENKWKYSTKEIVSDNKATLELQNLSKLAKSIQNERSEPYVSETELTPPEFDELKGTYNWAAIKLKIGNEILNDTKESLEILGIVENYFDLADFPPMAPEVMISRLKPNTVIKPHHGITNIKLTVHIPIDVPEGDLGLKVLDDIYRWESNTIFIFDDTYNHEAWNQADKTRSVLIFDIWNPQLLEVEKSLIKFTVNKLQNWNDSLNLLTKSA